MKTNKKLIIIISVVILTLAGASAVVFVSGRSVAKSKLTPDPASQNDEQIKEYLKSEQFRNLPEQNRREYMRGAMGQMMTNQAKKYCELPKEQRTAYLDEAIDSMRAWREQMLPPQWRNRDANDRPPNGSLQTSRQRANRREGEQRRHWQPNPEQFRARAESMDPTRRAQTMVFMEALRKRMQERGIESSWRAMRSRGNRTDDSRTSEQAE